MSSKGHCPGDQNSERPPSLYTESSDDGIAGQQDIVTSPSNVTVDEGDTVILQCRTVNKVGNLYWIKDEAVLISSETDILITGDRHSISGNVGEGEYDLQIVGVTGSDSGNYMCLLASAGEQDQKLTEPAKLTVITIATESPQVTTTRDVPIQSFSLEPTDAEVGYGDTVIFRCTIANKRGTQVWFKEANGIAIEELVINNDERLSVTGNQSEGEYNLKIVNVTEEDAGNYSCTVRAMGNSPVISSEATLTVKIVQHTFVSEPESETVELNVTVTLNCQVDNKEGDVIWYKDDIAISNDDVTIIEDDRYSIVGDNTIGVYNLQIESTVGGDTGNFQCIVTSGDDSDRLESNVARLTVLTIPTITTAPMDQTVEEGDDVILQCSVANKDAELVWTKDGVTISTDMTTHDVRYTILGSQSQYNLHIDDVTSADSGVYTCQMEGNPPVAASANLNVAVFIPPDSNGPICTTDAPVIYAGDRVTITCEIQAPQATRVLPYESTTLQCQISQTSGQAVWSKEGEEISVGPTITNGNNRYDVVGNHGDGEYNLKIDDISADDEGQYACTRLLVTRATQNSPFVTVYLDVDTETPHLYKTPISRSPREGYPVQLQCAKVNTDEDDQLQWRKDGQLISLDQSVEGAYQDRIYISGDHSKGEYYLNFYPILKSDGGSYTCQLSDVSSTSVTLSVRDALPPSHGFPSCTALDTELVIGSNITLECLSRDGQPPGELHWMRDHKRVSSYVVNSDDPDVIIIGVSLVLTSDDNGATYTCTLDHVTYDEPLTCVTGPLNVTGTETDWRVLAITFCVLLGVAIIIFIVVCIIIIWCVRNANKSIEADEENVEVVNADDKKDNKAHPKKDNVLLNNLDGSLKKKGKVDTSRDRKTPGKTTLTNTYYPPPSEYYDETLPSNGIGKRRLHSKNVVTPSKSKRMTNVVRNHQDTHTMCLIRL
uniref:Hemicentin-2-like n=1 Tax=Saccoglossus kowalevskii TaxID=10224 RepID=A0ABM0MP24_SACKO|nr:PREDICTED: hemicentin-2-like [Saccoglossus kowalevskii]